MSTDPLEDDEFDLEPSPLDSLDWADDSLFFTYEWRDETSCFDTDPSVRWEGGGEYYSRKFAARVPVAFKGCQELLDWWLDYVSSNHPETKGFWCEPTKL